MNLSELEFGALLTYTPRGSTPKATHSKDVMILLKQDKFVGNPPILMSKKVKEKLAESSVCTLFSYTILVPARVL
jgi:hypothetical protein